MLRNGAIICLLALMVLCVGCSEKKTMVNVGGEKPVLTANDCKTPECFFERYPENWEHELYQRQIMKEYERLQVAKK